LALAFAVQEINENSYILHNMTLGFDLYHVNYGESVTLETPFIWLSGKYEMIPNYTCRKDIKSAEVLTGTSHTTAAQIGILLELYKFPQVRVDG
jgi:vomeronasal 2 receptor